MSNNDEKIKKITRLLELHTQNLWHRIEEFYKPLNQHCQIIGNDIFEMMAAIINDGKCTASGGSGWDTTNYIEVKSSSHVQSYWSKSGKEKISFFNTSHNGRRKIPHDGRFGISSATHFKHYKKLWKYNLNLVEPMSDEASCREFRIRSWDMKKDNEYFNEYARRQNEAKSKGINFQPLSADFYFSEPVLILEGVLRLTQFGSQFTITYFDLDNTIVETIPDKFKNIDRIEHLNNKKFGKDRGKTDRPDTIQESRLFGVYQNTPPSIN